MKDRINQDKWLLLAIKAAKAAGEKILDIYNQDFEVKFKKDKSPLTLADQKANEIIESHLINSKIPILSEEGNQQEYEQRKNWDMLWIVDPLDGTKEFVKKNGEFTVNISLVEKGIPIIGVIFAPVKGILYYGSYKGVFREINEKTIQLPIKNKSQILYVVASRSHNTKETDEYFEKLKKEKGAIEILSIGSSLKFCLVAEGSADIYPRFSPTMEWDTAAGHAIANYAGKKVIDLVSKKEITYNRKNLKNNWFIVE